MIFQDAISSLNPRRTIREVVSEPLVIRWLESFPRSPVIRAWERYVPAMLKALAPADLQAPRGADPGHVLRRADRLGRVDRRSATRTPTASATAASAPTIGQVLMIVAARRRLAAASSCSS